MNRIFILFINIFFVFFQISNAQEGAWIYPFSYQNKWGIVDKNGQEISSPQLETLDFFLGVEDGKANAIARLNNKTGLIDRDGHWIIAPKMDSVGRRSYQNNYLRVVVKKGRFGVITTEDKKPSWLVKPKYINLQSVREGQDDYFVIATKKKGQGVINDQGKVIVSCIYDDINIQNRYNDSLIIKATLGEDIIYYNQEGNQVDLNNLDWSNGWLDEAPDLEAMYESAPGMAADLRYEKSSSGETTIILKVESKEQRVAVAADYKIEKVELTTNFLPEIRFILLSKDGKYGFMSPEGIIVTTVKYDRIEWDKYKQMCTLYLGDNRGLTDYYAKRVIPAVFSTIKRHNNFLFYITHPDGFTGYVTERGNVFLPNYVNLKEEE